MADPGLTRAALEHPALAAVREVGALLLGETCAGLPDVARMDAILGPLAGVRFEVQHGKRKRGEWARTDALYDGRIALAGAVPTRPGSLHDVMNALAWAAFPRSKRAIHARQHRAQRALVGDGARALPGARSREQDVLAMLDEGGLLLACEGEAHDEVSRALSAGDHPRLGALSREGACTAWVIGHAITEHVARGSAGVPRASTVVLRSRSELAAIDVALEARLAEAGSFLAPSPWPAVPIDVVLSPRRGRAAEAHA